MSHFDSRHNAPANDDHADPSARLLAEIAELKAHMAARDRQVLAQQDAERLRLARDLHDTLGQYFTIVALELGALRQVVSVPPAIETGIARLVALSETARRDVDQLAWEIRPPELNEPGGLAKAISNFLAEWNARTSTIFQSYVEIDGQRFSAAIEMTLFRIIQEGLRNVVKHASAKRAGIILRAREQDVRLTIEDDGVGFDLLDNAAADVDDAGGQGLRGIRERVALVRGKLEVETAPGFGTTLLIHIPLLG